MMTFWIGFLSVLAIVGIIVSGGVVLALTGKVMLGIFGGNKTEAKNTQDVTSYNYSNNANAQNEYSYQLQSEEQNTVAEAVASKDASQDYNYEVDVNDDLAMAEKEALNAELGKNNDEDDFFADFTGKQAFDENDELQDDDLLNMVDEISNDILLEQDEEGARLEEQEHDKNKSVLDDYSIDTYLDKQDEEYDDEMFEGEEDLLEGELEQEPIEEELTEEAEPVDPATMDEINKLKEEVKEILESMEQNNNKTETFNEQLINILNELKEANKKNTAEIKTEEDAQNEIESLRQQLEDSRLEMERQLQEKLADKDAEMQAKLQEQLDNSNAEINDLKAQLSALLQKMQEESEPIEVENNEIEELRNEVKEMLETMREETNANNTAFNAQLIEILNEMKEANLNKIAEVKVETAEEAVEEVNEWKQQLEQTQFEMERQFREQMAHKDAEMQAKLQEQMDNSNAEINELKEQLSNIMQIFKEESENAKEQNQALIDQLEAERQARIQLEKDRLDAQKLEEEQLEQLQALREENEKLADMLQSRTVDTYEPLTEEEEDDLYSEVTNIDYSAIKQMNDEAIDEKVKQGIEESKAEIEALREQVDRLTTFIQEREEKLAGQMNVHEVRSVDFDIEQVKEITAQEVEERVKAKLDASLSEVEALKKELEATKQEIEEQYKQQLSKKSEVMEYEFVNRLQNSAEEVAQIKQQLSKMDEKINAQLDNVKNTSEECVAEIESVRENKQEQAQDQLDDEEVAVVGPKNNKVALVSTDAIESEEIAEIDIETVKKLTEAEIDEMVEKRMEVSNKEIEDLKNQIETLKAELEQKDKDLQDAKIDSTVPVVMSPLFDVEAIKNITAQEVELKVKERLNEAMQEIEEMKKQLEASKKEIEKQYKEKLSAKSEELEYEMRARLKSSAAEVVELKEQLADLTEQIELERQQTKNNSEALAKQLEDERKEKEELAKIHFAELDSVAQDSNPDMAIVPTREVTVIGPKNHQVALVTGTPVLTESVDDYAEIEVPTIDIETVKKLTEQEIEEKVQQRMATSIIEIEELKKQILNLSIQIQEVRVEPAKQEKPLVFHYSTEEAYLERIAILEERLKNAKKDFKINAKELNPLEKVNRTLERDKARLRRKEAIVSKKQVALYGVNNYVDIDKEKAEKLSQELELLAGLRLSVSHCEEVMNANIDRYPILVHTSQILKENIANLESDIATLNKELEILRSKKGDNN